jgi:hypothetical protein
MADNVTIYTWNVSALSDKLGVSSIIAVADCTEDAIARAIERFSSFPSELGDIAGS